MSVADRQDTAATLAGDGQVMTLAYTGGGTYDPSTGTTSGSAPDSETVAGVILPLSPFRKSLGNVVEGDQKCLLAAQDTDGNVIAQPQVDGTLTDINGAVWSIVSVEPLAPAGICVLYELIVRENA